VAINDTSEESYASILAEAKTDSPISMAKPSTLERTGEMVEGKDDNKRNIMKNRTGWKRKMDKMWLARTTERVQNKSKILQHQFLDV
jgi:hypothetical protein